MKTSTITIHDNGGDFIFERLGKRRRYASHTRLQCAVFHGKLKRKGYKIVENTILKTVFRKEP